MRRLIFLFTLAGWLFLPPALARDVPFVPTPEKVVDRMLELAKVGPNDVVYDLGSGDGRIVIAAAKKHGARGVGIDIDPERIKEARENARKAGVSDRVNFREGDLFKTDLSEATVVTIYLLSGVNLQLRPKLLSGAQARDAHRVACVRHGRLEAGRDREGRQQHRLLLGGAGAQVEPTSLPHARRSQPRTCARSRARPRP